ncbi:MAG: STAS domain-containing protein [Methylococcaceae bacterium]|nr:STAS domain-containing protein [Methylococcaceae bacterium]
MLQSIQKDGNLVFQFSAHLDSMECSRIEEEVAQMTRTASQPVVFDLTGVDFVASAFLRLCIMVQRNAGGNPLTLVNVGPPIKKVFKISGLDTLLVLR